MINTVHPFAQRLPIKKRYLRLVYADSKTSLKVDPTPKVETEAPVAVADPTHDLALPMDLLDRATPSSEATTPSLESTSQSSPQSEQQVPQKRTHHRGQPRHRNSNCYHSFNFKYPQLEPLDLSKKHKCKDCTKSFRAVDRIKAHKRRHDIKKSGRYTCDECGKPFVQQSSLITHRRIHTGEKPYHCKVCNNSYGDLSTFTKHTRTHTGEKPYKCEYCDQRFSQSGNCLRHKRSVHADVFTWV